MGGFVFFGDKIKGYSTSTVAFNVICGFLKEKNDSKVVQQVLDPHINGSMDFISLDGLSDQDVLAFYSILVSLIDEFKEVESEWDDKRSFSIALDSWGEIIALMQSSYPFINREGRGALTN